ncbi:class I SAM-dependent methyltransferase [Flavobacteriaceae bacterium]|nr:class I SAM-dependent methyltransferase [Flavobacteriaceae bacterium]MDC1493115.1 class I SAM-dependent methyltransferase [Flavobacteriaceae bacterium]
MIENKTHWEKIYETKKLDGVSWFQRKPITSLSLIKISNVKTDAEVIDIGCGKSFLIDNLLKKKYSKVSVLDISKNAIKEVKERTAKYRNTGKFINSDVLDFKSIVSFDLWHDRAVFHFLTKKSEIEKYINISEKYINKNGILIVGTFSENGPLKCSGLEISRYSVNELEEVFSNSFKLINHLNTDHSTPFDSVQNFNFCIFKKIK